MDALAVDAMRRLIWKLSDCNLDVGALEITEMIFREASGGGKDKGCQKQSASMARMLAESLKVNDPVFLKVSSFPIAGISWLALSLGEWGFDSHQEVINSSKHSVMCDYGIILS